MAAQVPSDAQLAREHVRVGRSHLRKGDTRAAIAALTAAIEHEPSAATHHLLAKAYQRLDDLPAAEQHCRAALELDDRRAVAHFRLGDCLQLAGRLEEAAAAYQAAVDRDPSEASWHARLGYCRRKSKDWSAAAYAYRQATLRRRDHPMWHFWLGVCLERSLDWAGASVEIQRADRLAHHADPLGEPPSHQLPYEKRIWLSLVRRPQYAYGLYRAGLLARELGVPRFTAIEFGVAGGNGLVAMEDNAAAVTELTGIEIDVVGFDTGEGLYEPRDVRDMPYFFAAGAYAMDRSALEQRLANARLVLGDAAETFPRFLGSDPAPIGFVSFDMDVYSATAAVLAHCGDTAAETSWLPRVPVYFDDVTGGQGQDYNRYTGELLAIDEFNAHQERVKLAEDRTFRTLPINHAWHHGIQTLHRFEHPSYSTYISPADAASLSLRP